jgi:Sec-independent protein secretion pathway component TatC
MSPLTIVVTAFAVALVVMAGAFMGGAVIVAVPLALLLIGGVGLFDISRRRKSARQIQSHQHDDEVEFTDRGRRTLVSE